jgi:malonyl-CoA O-methyltransferase
MSPWQDTVLSAFNRGAPHYDASARLQRGVAWRLARHCRDLRLPTGPSADLGAGSGLLARALERQRPGLAPWRVDACEALLRRDPEPGPSLVWDLDRGIPPEIDQAALLASSFALHWLSDPVRRLEHWCRHLRPGGWLAVAVPTAGSSPQWRQAARLAGVPCTALPLPEAGGLEAVAAANLEIRTLHRLRFTRRALNALSFLREIRRLGAGASPVAPLSPGQWRRLEACWPEAGGGAKAFSWEILMVVARRPGR